MLKINLSIEKENRKKGEEEQFVPPIKNDGYVKPSEISYMDGWVRITSDKGISLDVLSNHRPYAVFL